VWEGFCSRLDSPSPKVQVQTVGDPLEVSVNWTVSGAVPDVGVPVKEATGAGIVVGTVVVVVVATVVAVVVGAVGVVVVVTVVAVVVGTMVAVGVGVVFWSARTGTDRSATMARRSMQVKNFVIRVFFCTGLPVHPGSYCGVAPG
jgi:hypothetical protein